MTLSFIGSGNVATHLALAFHKAGHTIAQIYSPTANHAIALAEKVQARSVTNPQTLETNICIIAVKDDAIPQLAKTLRLPNSIILHTSGSVDMDILSPISPHYGVLYAPQTFVRDTPIDYSRLQFCLEGESEQTLSTIQELARSLSSHTHLLSSLQRRKLHLASVIINNFGNALNALSQEMLQQDQIPFEILHPLVEQTAQKIHNGDLWSQQTGPAMRHDTQTIQTHIAMLEGSPDLQQIYRLMTQIILDHATH